MNTRKAVGFYLDYYARHFPFTDNIFKMQSDFFIQESLDSVRHYVLMYQLLINSY